MDRRSDSISPDCPHRGNLARLLVPFGALLLCLSPAVFAARISVKVEGLNDELKAVTAEASGIAVYAKRDVTAAQAHRLYRLAPKRIETAMEPYGYYNAHVTGELNETDKGFVIVMHVNAGEPTKVAELDLQVPDSARKDKPIRLAVAKFRPKKGQRLNQSTYEKSKADIQAALIADGYLDTKLTQHRVEVTRADNRAVIHLHWDPGVRYRYGETHFDGSQFRSGFLRRYIPWKRGDYYSQSQLLELQRKLVDADYFAIVEVQPDTDHAKDGIVPIKVTLGPAKRNVYTAGIFVDTDIGFGVNAGMTRRWLNRSGHKLKLETQIAQRQKTVSTIYSIPLPGIYHRSFNFGVSYLDQNTDTTQSRTTSVVANETRQWHGLSRTIGLHALTGDFTILDPNGNDKLNQRGNTTLLYPELVLGKKQADNPLFVHRGYSVNLALRADPGLISSTRFAQVRVDAKWIHALGRRQRVILRGSLGATTVGNFDKLPPQLRFFAGGDRTIRGYPYQVIGPENDKGLIVGGRDLALFSAEYEYYFTRNWGIATFVDTGDAFSGLSNFRNRIGTGLGLRWRSPVGMVRLDLGVPINDPNGRNGVQLHLTLGPDL